VEEVNAHLTTINANNSALRSAEADVAGERAKLAAEQASKADALEAMREEVEGARAAHEQTLAGLAGTVKSREATIEKITADKAKIEQYTKQVLHKFQDKYLTALQDCKKKLQDERAKNEALEARAAKDKAAQRREERLLSGSLYELGLKIMKEQQQAAKGI
jgi:protein HOOK3